LTSVAAEQPPGYGAEAEEVWPQSAWAAGIALRRIVLAIAGCVRMSRKASCVASLIVGLQGLQRHLIRIEWTRGWLSLDRRTSVCRRAVQLRKGYWAFIDGHAKTSRTVAE
jgi:hypothetical protein